MKGRGGDGDTSVDSMMEDTPANYNAQNQRFDADMDDGKGNYTMDDQNKEYDDEDEYGSEYDMALTGGLSGFKG